MMRNTTLAIGCLFLQVCIWAQKPYVKLETYDEHSAEIECLVLSPDNKTLITADMDGYLVFWNPQTMEVIQKVKAHSGGVTCLIFNATGTKFVTCGEDNKVKIWSTKTRKTLHSFTSEYNSVNFGVLSPDEEYLYFGGYRKDNGYGDDGEQFTGLYRVKADGSEDIEFLYDDRYGINTWGITDGNLDVSGKYIVFTKGYYTYFWDIRKERMAFKRSSTTNLNNLCSTPDYLYLWGDGYISKLDANNGYDLVDMVQGRANMFRQGYSKFAFSSNGKLMLTGDDGSKINIWNASTLKVTQVLSGGHTNLVRTFTFFNNDSIIISGGYDGKVVVWGYEEEKQVFERTKIQSADSAVVHTDQAYIKDTTTLASHPEIVEKTDSFSAPVISEVVYGDNNIPVVLKDRPVVLQSSVVVTSPEFEIEIWDKSVVDGDSISLNLNGEWILKDYAVVKTKLTLHVKVNPKFTNNYLVLYAHNLGEISPNTAAVAVLVDGKEYKLSLSSDMEKSAALNFEYKPKSN